MGKLEKVVTKSGNYNEQTVVGGFIPTIEDLIPTNTPHGLPLTTAYMYGSFLDDEGTNYNWMRNVGVEAFSVAYLYYKKRGESCMIHPRMGELYRGMAVNRRRGDELRVHNWKGIPGPKVSLRMTPDSVHFIEEGATEFVGKRIGLGMNVFWPKYGEDVYYSSISFDAEGTLFGKKVTGGLTWDQCFGPPGKIWQTMRFMHDIQRAWVAGMNLYDTGEKEFYHLASGRGEWGWLFASQGDRITAMSNRVKIADSKWDKYEYPARVLYTTDDGDWEFIGHEDCRLNPESQGLPMRWVEGVSLRKNEKRGLKWGSGWMEAYPHR